MPVLFIAIYDKKPLGLNGIAETMLLVGVVGVVGVVGGTDAVDGTFDVLLKFA